MLNCLVILIPFLKLIMPPIDSFWVKPIKEAIDDKLLDMITAENKHNLLSELKVMLKNFLIIAPLQVKRNFKKLYLMNMVFFIPLMVES